MAHGAELTGVQDNASNGSHSADDHDADVEDHQEPVEVQLPALRLPQEDVHGQGQNEVNGSDPQSPNKTCTRVEQRVQYRQDTR